ncbi:hypothetical protein PEC301645_28810 [Pectobacterium carotovorum subsp. carotovorum]|uniref:hypothetical protein n=1 Tax=Pectobacterium carotovorum TaxID=554 RepID=UPI00208379E7|nr:hypothetical protein [Pectobacterium carotovorum]GKV95434.1 hypothetical protein PEC301645_28810 [Pectobacterium carotovorum subsp. carotovorum]
MAKPYNFIYKQLVKSEDDVLGIIAYSIYKNQKINFIEKFKKDNGDQDPTEAQLAPFLDLSISPQQIDFYNREASVMTKTFLMKVLSDDLREREEFFSNRVHSEMKNIKPRHFLDILKGATGSLLFVILTGALYIAVWSLSISPKMVMEKIFDVQIVSNQKDN